MYFFTSHDKYRMLVFHAAVLRGIRFIKAAYTLSGTIYVHLGFINPVFIPDKKRGII